MADTTLDREPKAPMKALTVGEIAARLGRRVHQIEYIVESRGVKPMVWAGHARVFSETDFQYIASVLKRMDADRAGGVL